MSASTYPEPGSLIRWYIDTWPWTRTDELLPLLSTLQPDDQKKARMYIPLEHQNMSIASSLLKYLFIHRSCLVPWREITIRKTPEPHHKPYYVFPKADVDADDNEERRAIAEVEFNVSHQACLVALAGYTKTQSPITSTSACAQPPVIVGIDITCTDEPARKKQAKKFVPSNAGKDHTKLEKIHDYSDIFSDKEIHFLNSLRLRGLSDNGVDNLEERKLHDNRIFFTYWALKEAYVKMVGKGLIDPWVRDVEFRNVDIPKAVPASGSGGSGREWSPPVTGIEVFAFGKKLKDVRIEVSAWGHDFLVATAGTSISDAKWEDFEELDIERDVSTCAKGECDCLRSDTKS